MIFGKNKGEFKKEQTKEIGFEERERKTPFLGYVLLIAMAFVVLWLGFAALDDLRDVPQKPEALSNCASGYIMYEWQDSFHERRAYNYSPYLYEKDSLTEDCVFSAIEKKHGVDKIYNSSKEARDKLNDLNSQLFEKQNQLNILREQYGIGLIEDIARKPGIYSPKEIGATIPELEKEVENIIAEVDSLEVLLKPSDDQLKEVYQKVQKEDRVSWRWYDFKVFVLELIFVLPVFYLLIRHYFKLARKNSPYSIILTFLLIPFSIFLLKMVFVYLWGLFLAVILEIIWNFIANIKLLKSLLTYVGMILSAGVFGGLVYLLQKKIFDPKRVALRHLRDKKCPNCSFSLDLAKDYCSSCGHKMLQKCEKCGEKRYSDLSVCQHCGDRTE